MVERRMKRVWREAERKEQEKNKKGWGVWVEKEDEGGGRDLSVLCCCMRLQRDAELCYECSRPRPRDGHLHGKPGWRS